MVTRLASARQRPSSGGDAAMRIRASDRSAAAEVLGIGQCLLGLAPACKRLRRRALQKLVRIADAEMVAALVAVELLPGDRSGNRSAFAGAGGIRHDCRRAALIAQPVEEDS